MFVFSNQKGCSNIETFMLTCNPPEGGSKIYIVRIHKQGQQTCYTTCTYEICFSSTVKYVIICEGFNPTKAHIIGLKTRLHCCATSSGDDTESWQW